MSGLINSLDSAKATICWAVFAWAFGLYMMVAGIFVFTIETMVTWDQLKYHQENKIWGGFATTVWSSPFFPLDLEAEFDILEYFVTIFALWIPQTFWMTFVSPLKFILWNISWWQTWEYYEPDDGERRTRRLHCKNCIVRWVAAVFSVFGVMLLPAYGLIILLRVLFNRMGNNFYGIVLRSINHLFLVFIALNFHENTEDLPDEDNTISLIWNAMFILTGAIIFLCIIYTLYLKYIPEREIQRDTELAYNDKRSRAAQSVHAKSPSQRAGQRKMSTPVYELP
eukprot:UN29250